MPFFHTVNHTCSRKGALFPSEWNAIRNRSSLACQMCLRTVFTYRIYRTLFFSVHLFYLPELLFRSFRDHMIRKPRCRTLWFSPTFLSHSHTASVLPRSECGLHMHHSNHIWTSRRCPNLFFWFSKRGTRRGATLLSNVGKWLSSYCFSCRMKTTERSLRPPLKRSVGYTYHLSTPGW